MILRLFIHLLWAVACLAPVELTAQNENDRPITLRLLAFQPEQKVEEVFIHDPSAPADAAPLAGEIKAFLNHQTVTLKGPARKLVFTRDADRDSITRKGSLIAEVKLPENARTLLLLFLPDKGGANASSRIMILDESPGAFPFGSYLVTNQSERAVRLRLEHENFRFEPAQLGLIEKPPALENDRLAMRAFEHNNNKWNPIAVGRWPHPGDNRILLVFHPNPETGVLNVRMFEDARDNHRRK